MKSPLRTRTRSRKEQEVASDEESASRVDTDELFSPSEDEDESNQDEDLDDDEPKGRLPKGLSKKPIKKEASRKLSQLAEDIAETNKIQLRSLARHRNVLQKFVSEKVFRLLEAETKAGGSALGGDTSTIVTQPPSITNCTMRSYQLEGLNWMVQQYDRRLNCILGDEMGLGKTVQSIALIAHLLHVRKLEGPVLVVVPLTVLFNWMAELRRFCPSLQVLRMHASSDGDEQSRLLKRMRNGDETQVVVTTYEMLKQGGMSSSLKRMAWRAAFLDEGHRIKNEDNLVSRACYSIRAVFKVVLTGTPLQNNLKEAGALLKFLAPTIFTDLMPFEDAFNLNNKNKVIDRKLLDAAHYMLRPFLLRRVKSEVEQKLPPKLETKIICPMSSLQRELTQFMLFKERKMLERMEQRALGSKLQQAASQNDRNSMIGLMMHLRKAANHPFLFEGIESVAADGHATEELVQASGKLMMLDKLLPKLQEKGHRVVLFSQFTRTLDIICDYLDLRQYRYDRLDGSTNRVMREVKISLFNRQKSETFIFCLSTRAGGEGVNLFTADTVILFDSDWNPQVDVQAMARVHRIGQLRTVHIYRLVTAGSVEEMIVHRAQKKLFLDGMVNRGSTSQALRIDSDRFEAKELRRKLSKHQSEDAKKKAEDCDEMNVVAEEKKKVKEAGDDDKMNVYNFENKTNGTTDEDTQHTEGDDIKATKTETSDDRNSDKVGGDNEDDDDSPAAGQLFAALRFGWNSVFSGSSSASTGDGTLGDEDIDRIIDRTRGLTTTTTTQATATVVKSEQPSAETKGDSSLSTATAAASAGNQESSLLIAPTLTIRDTTAAPSTVTMTATVGGGLKEEQEMDVHRFDEHEPLATIDGLRASTLLAIEAELSQNKKASTSSATVEEELEIVEAEAAAQELRKRKSNAMTKELDLNNIQDSKRTRNERMQSVQVDGIGLVQILRCDPMVSLASYGQRSEAAKDATQSFLTAFIQRKHANKSSDGVFVLKETGRQKAGRDFQHMDVCMSCWDGGLLQLCDLCPCAYHADCSDASTDKIKTKNGAWFCPHHGCYTCARRVGAATLLFRCEHCEMAYCEDCLPAEAEVIGECQRFVGLGYRLTSNACYIRCSPECIAFNAEEFYQEAQNISDDENVNEASPAKAQPSKAQAKSGSITAVKKDKKEKDPNKKKKIKTIDLTRDNDATISNSDFNSDNSDSDSEEDQEKEEEEDDQPVTTVRRSARTKMIAKKALQQQQAKDKLLSKRSIKGSGKGSGGGKLSRQSSSLSLNRPPSSSFADKLSPRPSSANNTGAPPKFNLEEALGNCSLPDIRTRLERDELNIQSRFRNLQEIPNFEMRLAQCGVVARSSLLSLLRFVANQNRLRLLETENADNTSGTSQAKAESKQVKSDDETDDKESDEQSIYSTFAGLDIKLSSEVKISTFLAALQHLISAPAFALPQMAIALGLTIAAPVIMPKRKRDEDEEVPDNTGESKFVFPSTTYGRRPLEEAIAAFVVILSPQNLPLPQSGSKEVRKVDGLLTVSRLLQALGECAMDENKQYFVPIPIFESTKYSFAYWTRSNPRPFGQRPINQVDRLNWIWPAVRMYRRLLLGPPDANKSSNDLSDLIELFSQLGPSGGANGDLRRMNWPKPKHPLASSYLDCQEAPKLMATLRECLLLMRHMPAQRKQNRIQDRLEVAEAMERQRLQQLEEVEQFHLAQERAEVSRKEMLELAAMQAREREAQARLNPPPQPQLTVVSQQSQQQQRQSFQGHPYPVRPPLPPHQLRMQRQPQGQTPQEAMAQFQADALRQQQQQQLQHQQLLRQQQQQRLQIQQQVVARGGAGSPGQQIHTHLSSLHRELLKLWILQVGQQVITENENRLAQRELLLMLLWLVRHHKLLPAIGIDLSTLSTSLKLTDPSLVSEDILSQTIAFVNQQAAVAAEPTTWQEGVSAEQRQAVIAAIYSLLEEAHSQSMSSEVIADIPRRLQIYELALLCHAPSLAVYNDMRVESVKVRLVRILTMFHEHVTKLIIAKRQSRSSAAKTVAAARK